jgi:hypothetical protein
MFTVCVGNLDPASWLKMDEHLNKRFGVYGLSTFKIF